MKWPKKEKYKKLTGNKFNFAAFVTALEALDLTTCDIHFRLQTKNVPLQKLDFLGRFETFEADLKHVLGHLGLDNDQPLQKKNASQNRRAYQSYYTPELRDRVAQMSRQDIAQLGYRF